MLVVLCFVFPKKKTKNDYIAEVRRAGRKRKASQKKKEEKDDIINMNCSAWFFFWIYLITANACSSTECMNK